MILEYRSPKVTASTINETSPSAGHIGFNNQGISTVQDKDLERLINAASTGNQAAENEIAEFFLPLAIKTAQSKFSAMPSPMVDEEDVGNSALKSMCLGLRNGKLKFEGSKELGAALKKIVARKARKYYRLEKAEKRGRGMTRRESELAGNDNESKFSLAKHAAQYDVAPIVADETLILDTKEESNVNSIVASLQHDLVGLFRVLLNRLDDKPRQALLKLMQRDYSNAELATELGCAVATVERHRATIKRKLAGIQGEFGI